MPTPNQNERSKCCDAEIKLSKNGDYFTGLHYVYCDNCLKSYKNFTEASKPFIPAPEKQKKGCCEKCDLFQGSYSDTKTACSMCPCHQSAPNTQEEQKESDFDRFVKEGHTDGICQACRPKFSDTHKELRGNILNMLLQEAEEPADIEDGRGTFTTYRCEYLINAIVNILSSRETALRREMGNAIEMSKQGWIEQGEENMRKDWAEKIEKMFSVYPDGGIHDFSEDEELISKKQVLDLINPNEK